MYTRVVIRAGLNLWIRLEYALRDMNKPIGVSAYQLQDALPEQIKGSLPTIEELEDVLEAVPVETEDEA